jgi:hypothetical protein
MARCANLPVETRNGQGVGGGRVVGWLPIVCRPRLYDVGRCVLTMCWQVDDDPAEARKATYVNFKRVVWHQSFYALLASICDHSKTGFWFKCADSVTRHLFPFILILSADYEEQSVTIITY